MKMVMSVFLRESQGVISSLCLNSASKEGGGEETPAPPNFYLSRMLKDLCEISYVWYIALYHEKYFVRFPKLRNVKKNVFDVRKKWKKLTFEISI